MKIDFYKIIAVQDFSTGEFARYENSHECIITTGKHENNIKKYENKNTKVTSEK